MASASNTRGIPGMTKPQGGDSDLRPSSFSFRPRAPQCRETIAPLGLVCCGAVFTRGFRHLAIDGHGFAVEDGAKTCRVVARASRGTGGVSDDRRCWARRRIAETTPVPGSRRSWQVPYISRAGSGRATVCDARLVVASGAPVWKKPERPRRQPRATPPSRPARQRASARAQTRWDRTTAPRWPAQ